MNKLYLCVCFFGCWTTLCASPAMNSSSLEHEKALASLETAEILLTKAGTSFQTCNKYVNSTEESECGRKKPLAYIELSKKLIEDLRKNFPTCAKEDCKIIPDEKRKDCTEILKRGQSKSGIYTIWSEESFTTGKSLQVFCDMETDKGGWTVIQRRKKYPVQQDFYLGWESYKNGFGKLTEEFWLGNENIRVLCQKGCEIRFDLQDEEGKKGFAHYDSFQLDNSGNYTLSISGYSGTAGDNMASHNRDIFVTKDKNMQETSIYGAWWHGTWGGYSGNINGIYKTGGDDIDFVIWYAWRLRRNLASTEMKVRPK